MKLLRHHKMSAVFGTEGTLVCIVAKCQLLTRIVSSYPSNRFTIDNHRDILNRRISNRTSKFDVYNWSAQCAMFNHFLVLSSYSTENTSVSIIRINDSEMFYIHVERLLLLSGFIKMVTQGRAIPLQARTGREVYKSLKLPDFKTIGTWRWLSCQPYAPPAFTPQEIFLVLMPVQGWVDPRDTGRPEG
jgi:hypothetical protein